MNTQTTDIPLCDTETPIFRRLAELLQARANCEATGNTEWFDKHDDRIDAIMDTAPSGSGWDMGTKLGDCKIERGECLRLEFRGSFHHMNDVGFYDGWTDHTIIVRPAFAGFDVRVTGRDRNDIKDYLSEMFYAWLEEKTRL